LLSIAAMHSPLPKQPLSPAAGRLLQLLRQALQAGALASELRLIAQSPIKGADNEAAAALEAWVNGLRIEQARILCVSEDSDNEDLWMRYGATHTGVVFTLRHIPEASTPLLAAVKVDYSQQPPVIGSGVDFLLHGETRGLTERTYQALFFTKREQWSCQHEWRALTWRHNESTLYGDYRFHPEELASLTFGRAATPELRRTVSAIVSQRYPHCTVTSARTIAIRPLRE
jgi:hypothetical protein